MPAFKSHCVVRYHDIREFDAYEHFARVFSSRTFNLGYSEADVRRLKVQSAFEMLGAANYKFVAPKLVSFFRGLQ